MFIAFNKKPFIIFYILNFLLQIFIFIFSFHIAFRLEGINFSPWLENEIKAISFSLSKSSSWNVPIKKIGLIGFMLRRRKKTQNTKQRNTQNRQTNKTPTNLYTR